jgi:cellulose 1,4-beta-cellobiosidase
MLSKIAPLVAVAAVLAPVRVEAQQPAYAQCGGKSWTGSTQCVAGYSCNSINDYYYQCLAGAATAAPGSTTKSTPVSTTRSPTSTTLATTTKPSGTPVTTASTTAAGSAASGNPFSGYQFYANPYYASEVSSLAIPSLPASLKPAASAVAKIGSYVWLDTMAKVPLMETYVADISAKNKAGASSPYVGMFVVYDLPDRDCAALASNGELSSANGGAAKYMSYIDSIAAIAKKYPDVKLNLIIEPDSIANLVTNTGVAKCAAAADVYKSSVIYAMKTLNLPSIDMYLDGGHGGWLGWPDNMSKAAPLYASLYTQAGKPRAVRGIVTNVSNYNAWSIATCPAYTTPNPNCDEKRYIDAFAPLLAAQGFNAHFLVDTSRNGVQPTAQTEQGNWCNIIGAGFGTRPTTNTGDALVDAFVWVKPGGESDGTSDTTSVRYDSHCGVTEALKPAPEAGTWFEAYFQQLLQNANPKF